MNKLLAGGWGTPPNLQQKKTLFINAPLSASQSVNENHFFSKTTDRIFIKFHTNFWFRKDKKVTPPRKNHFGKKYEISLKVGLFGVCKNFIPSMCQFWIYLMHRSQLYNSAKTACFGKISFSSYILSFHNTKII